MDMEFEDLHERNLFNILNGLLDTLNTLTAWKDFNYHVKTIQPYKYELRKFYSVNSPSKETNDFMMYEGNFDNMKAFLRGIIEGIGAI